MLFKTTPLVLEDIDQKQGIVRVYWSAFGNRDAHGDLMDAQAYDETIEKDGPGGRNRIKVLWQHGWWQPPIGIPTALEVRSDGPGPTGGLLATQKIAKTQMGTDVLILYDEGVITEHSVGIDVLERDEDDMARILKVRLWEGSPVTWGANPLTPVVDMKSMDPSEQLEALTHHHHLTRHCLAIRKVLGRSSISDETGAALDAQLSLLEQDASRIQSLLLDSVETNTKNTGPQPVADQAIADWSAQFSKELATLGDSFENTLAHG